VKRNKDESATLMENIHQVLYTIISLYLKSEVAGSLAPALLDNIGKFMEWVGSIQERLAVELAYRLELFTRYIPSLRHNRMGTGSSTFSIIMRSRNYSRIVMKVWTKPWKSLRYAIYILVQC
jgi:hypothetical protein